MQPNYAPPAPGYPMGQYPTSAPPIPQQYGQPAQYQPAPQYAPPPMPGYPPVQYAPPAAPLAQGSIDDFYNQPATGGGKSLSFEQPGQTYVGAVARPIGAGNIQQQTDTQQRPLFFRDGRPKFVMKVPLVMQPSQAHPDGLGQWYVKGAARDELVRAMAEAGAPEGPPEAGATIQITFTGTRQSGVGMNPAKLFAVVYTRPGVAPAQQPAVQYAPAPAPLQAAIQYAPPAPPQAPVQYAPPAAPPPVPQAPVQAAPQAGPAMPPGSESWTDQQKQLYASMTGPR